MNKFVGVYVCMSVCISVCILHVCLYMWSCLCTCYVCVSMLCVCPYSYIHFSNTTDISVLATKTDGKIFVESSNISFNKFKFDGSSCLQGPVLITYALHGSHGFLSDSFKYYGYIQG